MDSQWTVLGPLAEIPCGANRAFKTAGGSVLVCHTEAGLFAVANRCTHQLAALEGGKMRGPHLFCPKHGARFDLRTGAPVGPLAKSAIQTFSVRVDPRGYIEMQNRKYSPPEPAGGRSSPQEIPLSHEQSNKRIVSRFLEVFSSGAVESTMAMMADDATWWVAGTMALSGTYDKKAFERLLAGVLQACEAPIRIEPKSYIAEGESVAVEAESFARTRNGRSYNNLYHFLFTVRDGKIARVKEYLDTMHANMVLCTP
jgi:ketosteroid isomerase-like protein/nitrite reductase/ring-hydroxylating ferredoxin subunit